MDIQRLAIKQLLAERQKVNKSNIIDRMVAIRKWLDKHGENQAKKIMNGGRVYQYGNVLKVI